MARRAFWVAVAVVLSALQSRYGDPHVAGALIPLLIAGLVAGAGSAIASAAGAAAGIGKNGEKVKDWKPGDGNVKGPNAGAASLFGKPGEYSQTDAEINRQRLATNQWQQGPQEYRNAQNTNLYALGEAAEGRGPSAADAQFQTAKDQGMAQQMAMAASARGSSALAGAQQAAMMNASNQTQQAAGQSAVLAAQEQQAARQLLTQTLVQSRGQDQADADRFAQMTQFYERLGLDTRTAQLQAQMAMEQMKLQAQGMDADIFLRTQGQRLDQGAQNAAADAKMFGAGVGGVSNAIGMIGSAYGSGGGGGRGSSTGGR